MRQETQKYDSPLKLARRLANQPVLDLVEDKAQSEANLDDSVS
jgi:hypothetical protein